MRARVVWFSLASLLSVTAARAAQPDVYSLTECIEAALQHSPDLGAAAADLAAARARIDEAYAGRYGDSGYTQVFGPISQAKGNPVFSPDDKNDLFNDLGPYTRLELEINVPLYTFGKLAAALEAAQQGLESEVARGEMKRAEVILNIKQLYYSLILSRQVADIVRDMLDTLNKAVDKTQERLDSGSKSVTELDVLKLKIGRSKLAKGAHEVEASIPLARSALARSIGVTDAADFEIADQRLVPSKANLEPLDNYLAAGVARRPEWKQVESGVAARTAQLELEKSKFFPTLFLATGISYAVAPNRTNQTNPFAYDEFNFVRPLGLLGIHWDLNFFSQSAKVAQARADLDKVLAERRAAESGLELDIRRAYGEVERQRETISSSEQGRKAARGWLILGVSNFDLGIGEPEELFQALGAYTDTSSDYLRAVYDYNLALAALSRAVGKEVTDLKYGPEGDALPIEPGEEGIEGSRDQGIK